MSHFGKKWSWWHVPPKYFWRCLYVCLDNFCQHDSVATVQSAVQTLQVCSWAESLKMRVVQTRGPDGTPGSIFLSPKYCHNSHKSWQGSSWNQNEDLKVFCTQGKHKYKGRKSGRGSWCDPIPRWSAYKSRHGNTKYLTLQDTVVHLALAEFCVLRVTFWFYIIIEPALKQTDSLKPICVFKCANI